MVVFKPILLIPIESVLYDLPGVKEYCDDLLIYGVTTQMSNYANYDAVIDQMTDFDDVSEFCLYFLEAPYYTPLV